MCTYYCFLCISKISAVTDAMNVVPTKKMFPKRGRTLRGKHKVGVTVAMPR